MLLRSIIELIFPRFCACCDTQLLPEERTICIKCLNELHQISFHEQAKTRTIERTFWGHIPIESALSAFHYSNERNKHLIHTMKYHNKPRIGIVLGRFLAERAVEAGFYRNIDIIVPVVLHKKRLRKRGYNQSEMIAKGLQQVLNVPIVTNAVCRTKNNKQQALVSFQERGNNVKDIFLTTKPELLNNKHMLIVDDVMTSGSTIISMCKAIEAQCSNVRFSIFTLAYAGKHLIYHDLDEEFQA